MSSASATPTDLSRTLGVLEKVTGPDANGNYRARCPAHNDDGPSLSIKLNGTGLLLNCFGGCEYLTIKAAITSLLSPDQRPDGRAITLAEFADAKALPIGFLRQEGLGDLPFKSGVGIPYRDENGVTIVTKTRTRLRAKDGSRWPKGIPLLVYGRHRLNDARGAKQLILVEGESDALTLWFHGLPALGIPGASAAKTIDRQDLAAIERLYVVQEPDKGGANFIAGSAKQLRELEFTGDLRVIKMPADIKDPSELHVKAARRFKAEFKKLLAGAEKIDLNADVQSETAEGGQKKTDVGNARRFAAQHRDALKYCEALGGWFIWNGKYWERDPDHQVDRFAIKTAEGLYAEIANETDLEEQNAAAKFALASQRQERLRAMINLARHMLAVSAEIFDRDPFALNCSNGIVDLRTGKMRPHDPSDLITKLIELEYDPKASAPRWRQFLTEIFPSNRELPSYLQRAVGYALTGDQREECFFVAVGSGSNGKGVLFDMIRAAIGRYGSTGRPELLIRRRFENANNEDLATLRGQRFVEISETNERGELDEGQVKNLTGQDTLKASMKYQSLIEFAPTHHIFLRTNNKPIIHGTDYAIWRRVKIVLFNVNFVGQREYDAEAKSNPMVRVKDTSLRDTLRNELQGILAWAIRGAALWWNNGKPNLREPKPVTDAVDEYRSEMDRIGQFIDERCERDAEAKTLAIVLYHAYKAWALDKGWKGVCADNTFGRYLLRRNFERKKTNVGKVYIGLKLKPSAEERTTERLKGSAAKTNKRAA